MNVLETVTKINFKEQYSKVFKHLNKMLTFYIKSIIICITIQNTVSKCDNFNHEINEFFIENQFLSLNLFPMDELTDNEYNIITVMSENTSNKHPFMKNIVNPLATDYRNCSYKFSYKIDFILMIAIQQSCGKLQNIYKIQQLQYNSMDRYGSDYKIASVNNIALEKDQIITLQISITRNLIQIGTCVSNEMIILILKRIEAGSKALWAFNFYFILCALTFFYYWCYTVYLIE